MSDTKVFILPTYNTDDKGDGGVRRVVEAMAKYLPAHGVKVVNSAAEADVLNFHGTMYAETYGKPVVASCHGLYWREYDWPKWAHEANKRVTEVLVRAEAVTSPSKWVSKVLTRGLLLRPETIYHGVDADYWDHELDHYNYVLWNKARVDAVSDPTPALQLARMFPNTIFVFTTLGDYKGPLPLNVKVVGVTSYEEQRELIQRAGLYLATTRETFGIGTLEALAAGVPVVGWNYGGQREIIRQGTTGYLANPGDYSQLADATRRAFAEREGLSRNCRADARARWRWEDRIGEYARLFRRVHEDHADAASRPRVSVLVTTHDLGSYLGDAIRSVREQTEQRWECVVVDDASVDETPQLMQQLVKDDPRVKYVRSDENVGLSAARNLAFQHSIGRYVIPLDADDMLDRNALKRLADALDDSPEIHVAYGHLALMGNPERASWPPDQFDWFQQLRHNNQLPYSAMMRRSVLERVGGYRKRDWRAEDAALWCRVTSRGMRARKVTQSATLIYRWRSDGKTASENAEFIDRDGDWTWFTPWARKGSPVPWAAQAMPPRDFWPVPHLEHPKVTVIIPVGDRHEPYLPDALDSVLGQTYSDWDVIVVDDTTTQEVDVVAIGAPYAEVLRTGGKRGPGHARNIAVDHCRTEWILFLDADDYLVPTALSTMVKAVESVATSFVYGDGYREEADGTIELGEAPDYEQKFWLMDGQIPVTSLIKRDDFREVGGFDEEMEGWEDKELFIKMAVKGHCGLRIQTPLFVYRLDLGGRRDGTAARAKAKLVRTLDARYRGYVQGEEEMCGCKGNTGTISAAYAPDEDGGVLGGSGGPSSTILMEFTGKATGMRRFKGNNGRFYFGGNQPIGRRAEVHLEDVSRLESTGVWRRATEVAVSTAEGSGEVAATPPPQPTKRPPSRSTKAKG